MQVAEGGQDAQHVGDGLLERQRRAGLRPGARANLAEGLTRDVLHDDVAGVFMLDEVVDLDDVRMFDLRQELAFGDSGRGGGLVLGIEQALEHHPHVAAAMGQVEVLGQIDPPEPTVGDASGHAVLTRHQVAFPELR